MKAAADESNALAGAVRSSPTRSESGLLAPVDSAIFPIADG
jgi:hypothetical protein